MDKPVFARCAVVVLAFGSACASLGSLSRLIQPLRFSEAEDQPAEIRLVGPGAGRPLGGAAVRIWTRVSNPNPFGLRLSTLETTLLLDGSRAATGDFPLGLPLGAGEESVIPLDLSISFADMAGLSEVVRNAIGGQRVAYQLDGTIGIDAGALGQPTFGPVMLFRGELSARRDPRLSLDLSGAPSYKIVEIEPQGYGARQWYVPGRACHRLRLPGVPLDRPARSPDTAVDSDRAAA